MRDREVGCLFALRHIIVVFDTDTKQEDVRIKLNEGTKFIKTNRNKESLCRFALLDIRSHALGQLRVVVRTFDRIPLDVVQIHNH